MTHAHLAVDRTGERRGRCDCCGHERRTVWGNISSTGEMIACYFVQWTKGYPEHDPNRDFPHDRVLVSWVYSASRNEFMLIDGASRPAARSDLCSRALTREQVLSNPDLVRIAKSALDAVWLSDARIEEIRSGTRCTAS